MTAQPRQSEFSVRIRSCRFCLGAVSEYMGLEVDPGCRLVRWPGGRIVLSNAQAKLLAAVVRAGGHPVSTNELIDTLYGEREDGGPDWADKGVSVFLHHLRRRLLGARAPLRIRNLYGRGYEVYVPQSRHSEKGK